MDTLHTCHRKGSDFDLRSSTKLWDVLGQGNHSMEPSPREFIQIQDAELLVEKAEIKASETEQDYVQLRKEYVMMYIIHSFH